MSTSLIIYLSLIFHLSHNLPSRTNEMVVAFAGLKRLERPSLGLRSASASARMLYVYARVPTEPAAEAPSLPAAVCSVCGLTPAPEHGSVCR